MNIQFFGAARNVTGSKHLITTTKGKRILLDCGMFQGKASQSGELNRTFGFNPTEIDFVILSHAHIDHSGLLPLLVKQGFAGKIFSTSATFDLCAIMLADTAHIQENDLKYINKRKAKSGEKLLKPLYTIDDVQDTLALFETVDYKKDVQLTDDFRFRFYNNGHIIGSAAVYIEVKENNEIKKIFFTADIGRLENAILKEPEAFPQVDYLITESTYGDREHDGKEMTDEQLLKIVNQTCVEQKGKLIVPAFSLGRTQEIVYALDQLEHKGLLPKIKVYVDSPLSTNATNIIRRHKECFNEELNEYMENDPDPFGFNRLHYVQDVEESKALNDSKEPCIIISASGMLEAGRIKHHVKNNIENPNNTILMIGYCEPSSLGARLISGEPEVKIFGDFYKVLAKVVVIDSFSAHGDYLEMIKYLSCQDSSKIKKTFLVHGEYETQINFAEKLKKIGFNDIEIPALNDSFEL
ncbi:MAG: MBL fold metallo-hydrolase [Bacteroidota bacterium]